MPFEIKYDSENDCMICKMIGKIDQQLINDFASNLSSLMEQHQCTRMINDIRDAEFALSNVEIYNIPKLVSEQVVFRGIKRAIVYKEPMKNINFYETVSVNRAQNLKIFTDYDEAFKWATSGVSVNSKSEPSGL